MKDYKFGNYLTKIRTGNGLSQYQLGILLGVSDKAVSKWENGDAMPRLKCLQQMAKVLEVPVEELLNQCKTPQDTNDEKLQLKIALEEAERKKRYREFLEASIRDRQAFLKIECAKMEEIRKMAAMNPESVSPEEMERMEVNYEFHQRTYGEAINKCQMELDQLPEVDLVEEIYNSLNG